MQSLKGVELVPEHILATHSAWILCLDIDHGLWFGSYSLMVDGTICNESYGLWPDPGSKARANIGHAHCYFFGVTFWSEDVCSRTMVVSTHR